MSTFFGRLDPKFSLPPDDGKEIEVIPFLEAARQIPPFFDFFGLTFKVVKSDFTGNIQKLQNAFDKKPGQFKTFHELLLEDVKNNDVKHKNGATQALLWFKRGLHFMFMLLSQIVEAYKTGKPAEDISPIMTRSYEESLKPYHKWMLQKVFAMVLKSTPYRRDLIKKLANNQDDKEEEVHKDLEEFLQVLGPTVDKLSNMFTEMNLDFPDKV